MKKFYISTLAILLSAVCTNAQGIFDAVRLTNPSINGTARYMSMAGSFGALGGDASAVMDNPATLGIFRSNEFNVSFKELITSTSGTWDNNRHNGKTHIFKLNNLSLVLNIPSNKESGYLASNFLFGYQKVHDFNRRVAIKKSRSDYSMTDYMAYLTDGVAENDLGFDGNYDPFTNIDIAWLSVLGYQGYLINPNGNDPNAPTDWFSFLNNGEGVSPYYDAVENGSVSDYNFAYSGNVDDVVYFGISAAARSLEYSLKSTYGEDFENGGFFEMSQLLNTSGLGINFKFGTIVRPVNWFRIGLSFQTPTYYTMNDANTVGLSADVGLRNVVEISNVSPYTIKYKLKTPYKLQVSLGSVVGTTAALNIDYQFSATDGMKFGDYEDNVFIDFYQASNKDIKSMAKPTHTIKLGAEVKVAKFLKLRGGFGYITSPITSDAHKFEEDYLHSARIDTEYFNDNSQVFGACGVGFNLGNVLLDLAYMYNHKNQTFTAIPKGNTAKADIKNNFHSIVATFAWRY